ncbi:putative transcriptional regulator, Crp/Fnr family [Alkaliphilus metalliredigens QYMF]|uniref:Putative transcriptional regulator, Crp/Fnr family n=1 Tax=Alkaliphilus metalliredigens (strain QYMF) TaxID=293826 RepID=A6TMB9_ALKMQ|nr:Crp/Fnr family transcriptional regulator [Alkaliphilus metalliredigens]ABR47337.1 putative transcriptional regulator, Crp/Fnr family [Alkaliphilus metalliredigens QYMF]
MMDSRLKYLNKCILFDHLSTDEIEPLFSTITYHVKCYQKNEVVFSPHHSIHHLGIILEGSVDVQKIFASGKAITVNRRFQYDLIADAALFANIQYYPSTISTCENSIIFFINKNDLLKLFAQDEIIMSKFLKSVSNRVLALNKTIEILSLSSVSAKIASFLLMEQKKQNSFTIRLQFSKKSLAEHLNVSRPTLSRELKNMQTAGLISFQNRTITIHSLERLVELCSV